MKEEGRERKPGMPQHTGRGALIAGDNLHCQAAARGFTIFGVHIFARFVHGLDDFIEAHPRLAGAAQGHTRGVDRLDRCDSVTLDARHLHLAGNRIAGETEVVLHTNFRRDAYLTRTAAKQFSQTGRRH